MEENSSAQEQYTIVSPGLGVALLTEEEQQINRKNCSLYLEYAGPDSKEYNATPTNYEDLRGKVPVVAIDLATTRSQVGTLNMTTNTVEIFKDENNKTYVPSVCLLKKKKDGRVVCLVGSMAVKEYSTGNHNPQDFITCAKRFRAKEYD
jgi:hypothetical protein